MRNAKSFTIALAIGAGLIVVNSLAEPKPESAVTTPINLTELHERGIEGSLGKPLGTIVEVTGFVIKNDSKAKADVSERYFVRVETVDGQSLPNARVFPQRQMPLDDEMPGIKIGDHFQCIGYETGVFTGFVVDEFKYVPPYASQPYHFETHFAVLKAK